MPCCVLSWSALPVLYLLLCIYPSAAGKQIHYYYVFKQFGVGGGGAATANTIDRRRNLMLTTHFFVCHRCNSCPAAVRDLFIRTLLL